MQKDKVRVPEKANLSNKRLGRTSQTVKIIIVHKNKKSNNLLWMNVPWEFPMINSLCRKKERQRASVTSV
jgi:hypothetical protein